MEPLIVSPMAARRLKTLLGHGVQLSERLLKSMPFADNGSDPPGLILEAGLLPSAILVLKDSPTESAARDILSEMAISQQELEELGMRDGGLVEVRNPGRRDIPVHLAHVWASPNVSTRTALLAPSLAHNLGLALHLWPLLQETDTPTGDMVHHNAYSQVHLAPYVAHSRNCSTDLDASHGHQNEITPTNVDVSSPNERHDEKISSVPIATEVQLAIIREPRTQTIDDMEGPERSNTQSKTSHAHRSQKGIDNAKKASQYSEEHGQEIVEGIQLYLMNAIRVVSKGDVFAVCIPSASATGELLGNIAPVFHHDSKTEQGEKHLQNRFVYVKVQDMMPSHAPYLAIDVSTTVVKMTGTCCAALPVGLPGYLSHGASTLSSSLLGWHPTASWLDSGWELPYVGALLPSWRHIARICAPALHPAAVGVPLRLALLLHGPSGSGKRTSVAAAAAALGCHPVLLAARDISGEQTPDNKAGDALRAAFDAASRYRPALLVISNVHELAGGGGMVGSQNEWTAAAHLGNILMECIVSHMQHSNSSKVDALGPVILFGCAPAADALPAPLRRCFTHEIAFGAPDRQEREMLMRSFFCYGGHELSDEEWADAARHTAGLLPRDLRVLAADASTTAAVHANYIDSFMALDSGILPDTTDTHTLREPSTAVVLSRHVSDALEAVRERTATDIGAPKIPNVRWVDVGGLEDVKAAVLDTVELPLRHPELFSGGLRRRSGVLLYGPPGTGKTLLAKAVATECSVTFLSVKGPELINMYVGESERLVRDVFSRARRARPCVIFFDELDSLAPARGRGSDSGGVMDRVVSQLLAEIDNAQGGSGTDDVFIIGATNRPDLLDPALLRPGRLDKLLYIGVAKDADAQLKVIHALTRKFLFTADVDLREVADKCPGRLTGADLYALCSDAWMTALKRTVKQVDENEVEGNIRTRGGMATQQVTVCQQDFLSALHGLRPSLTEVEVARYEAIRDQYQA